MKINLLKKWHFLLHSNSHKYTRRILLITFFGFILRLIAARNLEVLADDMVYASQSAGIFGAKLISTHSNPPLFFYLTDIAYKLFGYTTIASRLWATLCGALLIPLAFLICNKLLKDQRKAFFAAIMVAISSFLIRMSFTEQSLVVLFFIFFGVYVGMLFLDNSRKSLFIVFSTLFGLALLTKYNAPFFILAFGVYSLWYVQSKNTNSKPITLKSLFLLIAIFILFSLPFLSFNYLLYNQKGIVDVYFSRLVHLNTTQELYGGLGGQENSFTDNLLNLSNYGNYSLPFLTDSLLVIFAVFGVWKLFKNKNKNVLMFTGCFLFIPFILQSAGAPLQKHFAFMYFILAIPASEGIHYIYEKIKNRKILKIIASCLFLGAIIFSWGIALGTPHNYLSQGPTAQLKSFINEEVTDSSLLIFDSRIYTARSMWLATDKAYLTFDQATEFLNQVFSQKIANSKYMKVYFVECVVEDCGWGWVNNNQNLNNSAEQFIDLISKNSDIIKKISTKVYDGNELKIGQPIQEYYKVYSTMLNIPTAYLSEIKKSQAFYFTPYLYLNLNNYLFNYKTIDPFSRLLDKTSYVIILISVILSIVSVLLVFLFLLNVKQFS